jgi:hypothetical protein
MTMIKLGQSLALLMNDDDAWHAAQNRAEERLKTMLEPSKDAPSIVDGGEAGQKPEVGVLFIFDS